MRESELWEWVAAVRAIFPNQPLDDATVERWERVVLRWDLPVALLAVGTLAEDVERWRGLSTFIDAYHVAWREAHPDTEPRDERPVEERRSEHEAALALRDRWTRVHAAMAQYADVRAFVRERFGNQYDGWRSRRPPVDSMSDPASRREPTFAPDESARLLEEAERLIGSRPVGQASREARGGDEWYERYKQIREGDVVKADAAPAVERKRPSRAAVDALGL